MRFEYLPKLLAATRLHEEAFTVGSRIACHTAVNNFMRQHFGKTPDRWIFNYAHAVVETKGFDRSEPLRFAMALSVVSYYASLRWNRSISRNVLRTTSGWIRGNARPGAAGEVRPMRIGFDISQTGQAKAGCGWFADCLIRHLAEIDTQNEYILYPTFGDSYWDAEGPAATARIDRPNFRRGLSQATLAEAQQFWRNPGDDFEARLGEPDIVHANNFFCPHGLSQARLVYTLHDLMFLEQPESTTEANRNGCFTGVFHASLHADLIVAVSQYSRRHFLDIFPHYPSDRVAVAHLASRFHRQPDCARPGKLARLRPGRFWLTVGTIEPRKNHRRLLQAYARLKAQVGESFPLALAGGKGWLMEDFESFVDKLGLRRDIVGLGYVEEAELQWLYQNCFAFLYPSLFEGFGLPGARSHDARRTRYRVQYNLIARDCRRGGIVGGSA